MYNGTLAIAGECMATRPFANHKEPEFLGLLDILRQADTAYCHLEMNLIPKDEGYPGRAFAVSALRADPVIAEELRWAGIDIVSAAYNHSLDWGIPGVTGTIGSLDNAGIVHAGLGRSLEEARAPRYFESAAGRVAIIAMASGQHPYDAASPANPPIPGRPGVNALRVNQKYYVDAQAFDELKSIWGKLGIGMRPRFWMQLEDDEMCISFGDHGGGGSASFIFKKSDHFKVENTADDFDLEGNLRMVREARRQADLVVVCHHAAINDGERGEKPASLVPPLARELMDAGADVFIGHGWHRQLGVDIYKGKPIFYGTGNFFAQSQFLEKVPSDTYEGHGFGLRDLRTLTSADWHDAREGRMAHWRAQPWGILSTLGFKDGAVSEIRLHPFSMGYDTKGNPTRMTGTRMEGRPMLISGDEARTVIGEMARLCNNFGTKVEERDGVGIISL